MVALDSCPDTFALAEAIARRCEDAHPYKDAWRARCPNHQGKSDTSFSITPADDRVLIKCFGECAASDVVQVLGLTMADLFVQSSAPRHGQKRIVKEYDYHDAHGTLVHQTVRYEPKASASGARWRRRYAMPNLTVPPRVFDPTFRDRVRDANPLAHVINEDLRAAGHPPLAGKGEEVEGWHPAHGSTSGRSLKVNTAKQVYYCFNCGEGGDIFAWVMLAQRSDVCRSAALLGRSRRHSIALARSCAATAVAATPARAARP